MEHLPYIGRFIEPPAEFACHEPKHRQSHQPGVTLAQDHIGIKVLYDDTMRFRIETGKAHIIITPLAWRGHVHADKITRQK
jgi:hypothetical protein